MNIDSNNSAGAGVQTLIVGLGATGLSCARFLRERGESFAVIDSRAQPPGLAQLRSEMPEVPVSCGDFDAPPLRAATRLLLSPGVPLRDPHIEAAVRRGAEILGDIELFARHADAPVVAITGSNGKSTVTTLVGEMAKAAGLNVQVGGNLGTPALDLLQAAKGRADYYILELSSFQLETTRSLNAYAAVVLNISPDHMDRYASVEEYAAAKRVVYNGDGVVVVNRDDPAVLAMEADILRRNPNRRVTGFTLRAPRDGEFGIITADGEEWLAAGRERLLMTRELRIAGKHNQANALAALALGEAMGLSRDAMLEVLRAFPGLPHRTQWVAAINGVNWYNDSKGTNVGATVAAVAGMPGTKILILGGDGKGADFSPLKDLVTRHQVKAAVLIGRDGPLIAEALKGSVPVTFASDMANAVQQAQALASPGDCVLLSPACASFDMFTNYVERGKVFEQEVRRLAA